MANTKLDVRVYPIDEPKGNTMAFASVAANDIVAIRGIRVMNSEKGLFVNMPQSKDKEDKYHDIAFPVSGDLRKQITEAVLNEYVRVAALAPGQRGYEKPDKDSANNINTADIKIDIRIYPINNGQNNDTKAFASVTVDDLIAIRGIRVVEGEKGLFTTMPQSKDKNGGYHDIAFPLNGDLRKEINKAILEKYNGAEKSEKKQTLADGLRNGTEKAADQSTMQRPIAAKSYAGAIE